jgi:hypothetical protein
MVICGEEGFDQLCGIHSSSIDLENQVLLGSNVDHAIVLSFIVLMTLCNDCW